MRNGILQSSVAAAIVGILCAFGAAPAASFEGPGATGAAYLGLAAGPVSAAMGEVGAALEGDPFNWIVNPALLGNVERFGMGVSHAEWILDTRFEHAEIHHRANRLVAIGAGIVYRYAPEIQGYDDVGAATELLDNSSYQAALALAFTPLPGLSAGVTAKYFRETLAEWSAGGAAADVGFFYAWPAPRIAVGLSVQNLGPDVSFDGVDEPLPTTIRGGTSAAFALVPAVAEMRIAADIVKPRFESLYAAAGAELTLSGTLSIRAGWCGREHREGDGLTLGGGVKILERLQFDYAYTPYGDLGDFHRIAVHFSLP
jgi:hypothetical protein